LTSPYKDHQNQYKHSNVANVEQQHNIDGHEYVLQGYSTLKKELEPNKLNEPNRSIKSTSLE